MQITKLDISKWVVAAAAVSTSELWITSRQTHLKLDAVPFFFQFCSAEISIELHFVPTQQQRFKYLLCCCAPIRQQKRNNSSACRRCTALASMNSTALYKFHMAWECSNKILVFQIHLQQFHSADGLRHWHARGWLWLSNILHSPLSFLFSLLFSLFSLIAAFRFSLLYSQLQYNNTTSQVYSSLLP